MVWICLPSQTRVCIAVEGGVLGADGGKEGLQERPGGVEGGDGGHWAGGRRRRWGRRRGRGRWRWYQVYI